MYFGFLVFAVFPVILQRIYEWCSGGCSKNVFVIYGAGGCPDMSPLLFLFAQLLMFSLQEMISERRI